MTNINYKGYSIEQERDGSFSVFHPVYHYCRGHFKSINEACQYILGKNAIAAMVAESQKLKLP